MKSPGGALRVALVLAALATAYVGLYGVRPALTRAVGGGDFAVYMAAGRALLEGKSPYTMDTWNYPPLMSFLVAPLAALPFRTAWWCWFLLSHACVAWAAWWTARALAARGVSGVGRVAGAGGSATRRAAEAISADRRRRRNAVDGPPPPATRRAPEIWGLRRRCAPCGIRPEYSSVARLAGDPNSLARGPRDFHHGLLGPDWRTLLVVATTWAAGHSLAGSLIEGQVNAILLVALCLTLWPPAGARWLGAAAVAAAFALKIWPGILWAEDLLRRRWRRLLASVALAGALVAVPLAVIACWLPGPLRPQRAGNFFSTPAFLNASLPGLALRLRDPARRGAELPRNWVLGGLVGELRLDPSDRILAASVSVTALAAGLALLAAARRSDNEPWQLGAALVALALVAAPVSWPHYPVLQLPGTAALADRMIARRCWWRLAALAACFLSVNWTEAIVVGPYVAAYGTRVVEPLVTWTLSTLPVAGGAGLFALQLGGLRDVQDAA